MHELSITQSMLDLVLEQAKENNARRIGRINVVIGEMTGVVADSMKFYFDFIKEGTIAEGAVLSFRMVPTQARCRSCGQTFEPEEFSWGCPHCQNNGIEIINGKELFVESMEVE